eukprot:g8211.t1
MVAPRCSVCDEPPETHTFAVHEGLPVETKRTKTKKQPFEMEIAPSQVDIQGSPPFVSFDVHLAFGAPPKPPSEPRP